MIPFVQVLYTVSSNKDCQFTYRLLVGNPGAKAKPARLQSYLEFGVADCCRRGTGTSRIFFVSGKAVMKDGGVKST